MSESTTLGLFGASGRTGQAVVRAAATRGVSIRALCRPASRFEQESRVHVVRGDLCNAPDVEQTIDDDARGGGADEQRGQVIGELKSGDDYLASGEESCPKDAAAVSGSVVWM